MNFSDGTPYELKGSCTVWVGGKDGDYIKVLPIDIGRYALRKSDKLTDDQRQPEGRVAHSSGIPISMSTRPLRNSLSAANYFGKD